MISIFRHGINNDDIGPIAKASFEETTEMFLQAAKHGMLDEVRGVSANVMCGQEGYYGTSSFQVYIDSNQLFESYKSKPYNEEEDKKEDDIIDMKNKDCLLYTSPSPRDVEESRMPSSA